MDVDFEFEEEVYVDDIPFDTQKVAVEKIYKNALNEVFTFTDEPYIDDIPYELIKMKMKVQSIKLTVNEPSILFARVK